MSAPGEFLIAGAGCSVFGARPGTSFRDLLCEAVFEAMWDAGIAPGLIDAGYLATSDLGSAPAADVLRRAYEIARQLQGCAGERQVPEARAGTVHGASGVGSEGFVAALAAEGAGTNG